MELIYFILLEIIVFLITIFANKRWGKDALFTIGIGCAIGANVYNIGNYPINAIGLTFGIDSIIYTLFIFCIVLCQISYGKKSAINLLFTVICAILLTALLQFSAGLISFGIGADMLWGFASFIISAIATGACGFISIIVFDKLKTKLNVYVNIIIFIFIASVVNSIIYFGLIALFGNGVVDLWKTLIGSYFGKGITLCFAILSYYITTKLPYKAKIDKENNFLL